MRSTWRAYLENLKIKKAFFHRDNLPAKEFEAIERKFPAIFLKEGGQMHLLFSADDLQEIDLIQLMQLIDEAVTVD